MIRDERLSKIATYINTQQFVSIEELVLKFKISKATVHRDLDILKNQDLVSLSRGGARRKDEVTKELLYDEKLSHNREEKIRIGEYAATLIKENQTIFLDTGVTAREMASFLGNMRDIHIITNDVWIASYLATNANIKVTLPGGDIRRGYYTICGHETEQFLSRLHVDVSFISIDAIDLGFGCSIVNNNEVLIKQKMIAQSSKTVMIADHSKFNNVASWQVCSLEEVDIYISGSELQEKIVKRYNDNKIKIKVV